MRLMYIANIRLPTEKAHGLQIMKTCEALARQGIEVELIIPRRLNHLTDDPFAFYSVEKNFKITRVWCWDLISRNLFGSLGFWIESWTFYRSVKKYLVKQPAAVYYTRDLPIAYWLSQAISPIFYEIHTLPDVISAKHKRAWKRAVGIIVISQSLQIELVKQGVSPQTIVVARDAVDTRQFKINKTREECRQKLGLPFNQKIIVYTGHLYEWKGTNLMAEAARSLPQDFHFYVVGGTSADIDHFRTRFSTSNFHVIGWRPHLEMPLWQWAADVLLLPTSARSAIGSKYTSPLKFFEYLASGTPIVASDISSTKEILSGGGTDGIEYFEPDNPEDLRRAIIEAFGPKKMLLQTGAKKTATIISTHYTWENRAKIISSFFKIRL